MLAITSFISSFFNQTKTHTALETPSALERYLVNKEAKENAENKCKKLPPNFAYDHKVNPYTSISLEEVIEELKPKKSFSEKEIALLKKYPDTLIQISEKIDINKELKKELSKEFNILLQNYNPPLSQIEEPLQKNLNTSEIVNVITQEDDVNLTDSNSLYDNDFAATK